jgi:peptidoglycan/LPS O-acetylase OafA/YrhL
MHIYLLFPVVLFARRRVRGALVAASAMVVSFVALWSLLAVSPAHSVTMAPLYYGFFVVAVVASMSRAAITDMAASTIRGGLILAVLGIVGATILAGPEAMLRWTAPLDVVVAVATVALLLLARRSDSRLRRVLSARSLVGVGGMGFSLYLTHAPVVQLVWLYVVRPLDLPASMAFVALVSAGTPVALLISTAFFRLVERHFLRATPRLFRRTGTGLALGAREGGGGASPLFRRVRDRFLVGSGRQLQGE